MKEKTCLALFSGGLDSMLAVKVMEAQGIKVIVLNFNTGFFFKNYKVIDGVVKYVKPTLPGIDVNVIDIRDEFFEMLKAPAYGYGSNFNPCIDCKILMLKKAKELMSVYDAGFVITGEVLGQRPMTQNERAIKIIQKRCGLEGYLIRPLSAKLLDETEPEKLGWVDRSKLLDINGRGRKRQYELAESFEIPKEFIQQPAGGCILTEEAYSKRMRDYLPELSSDSDKRNLEVKLLSVGRQFRKDAVKFIIGRNEHDNNFLAGFKADPEYTVFETPEEIAGPVVITKSALDEEHKKFIAAATAAYSDGKDMESMDIIISRGNTVSRLTVKPGNKSEITELRVDL